MKFCLGTRPYNDFLVIIQASFDQLLAGYNIVFEWEINVTVCIALLSS